MNIDSLIRQAIQKIKDNWGLPDSGFIAGGSISNIVWELVSGNKAVVNDIDVFFFDGIIKEVDPTDKKSLFRYQEKETKYWEDYAGMRYNSETKDFYTIESSEHDGMFNRIKYKSNKNDTDIILRSFDINCTRVGYSIEEDKTYWTKEFEEFLKTGDLRVCNLMTPSHTSIRIIKKKNELGCKLDTFELVLLSYALDHRFIDTIKIRFKDRYLELFNKYSPELSPLFTIERDEMAEEYVKLNFGEEVNLYYLSPKSFQNKEKTYEQRMFDYFGGDKNILSINSSQEFLFYIRNIYQNKELMKFWSKLWFFFDDVSYIDCSPSEDDLELISRIGKYAPNSIANLKGKKLSEQIRTVKSILKEFEEDPIVAISILESYKLDDKNLSEQDLLLLELSVRKKIVNDTKGKASKITKFEQKPEEESGDDKELINLNIPF